MELTIHELEILITELSKAKIFSTRTTSLMKNDLLRLKVRMKRQHDRDILPHFTRLHLGCGSRHVQNWLNVDIVDSNYDVDLASGSLPWKSGVFESIVSQQLIEHLEIGTELIPLLSELNRVLVPDGALWISCPDIEKICRSYVNHKMTDLVADIKTRWPHFSMGNTPGSHMINYLFHQNGEHKNLFDFDLLKWSLEICNFKNITRITEAQLLLRFPSFPARGDELQAIYVYATK